ncbi:MAG: hypothetical protein JNK73_10545 [Bacteroidia bacterium]|nr:hypothetical protein [Bacteroidia bacterium]
MKTIKHILGFSQLFIFLAFIAIGGLQDLLQSEKNTEPDYLHISVQHKASSSIEQGIYEIDLEKESEGEKFLKHASGLSSSQTILAAANSTACRTIKQLPHTLLHARPIFLELRTFRI